MAVQELMIVDGTALLFKMYFAKVPHRALDNREVGAVIGTIRALLKLLGEFTPQYVAVVFDAGARTFRNDILPTYKANRGAPPEDLIPQFDLVKQAVEELGIPTFSQVGFEADDWMATLSTWGLRNGLPVRMVTDDKDVMALIQDQSPSCVQWLYSKKEAYSSQQVFEKFGVQPKQMEDYLSLLGDSSDNIPGVKGVGAKSAAALLQHFGTLENLFDRLDEVSALSIRGSASVHGKLQEGKEAAFLAKRVVQLRNDLPLTGVDLQTLRLSSEKPTAEAFYRSLNGSYLYRRMLEYLNL